ncbi:MAG: rRNA maturation RNase YbeY [Clostridiales Family XIII bacterium]|jgi:probable rRNA maturation factor|nr:rRNA maturation RNase YbeY [Clostridiales Family XIII bacterium]
MIELSYDPESGYLPGARILERMEKAAEALCRDHRVEDAEISLSFVSPEAMKSLNNRYRAVDAVTDVLSFPQEDMAFLGDVVICTERAKEQAAAYGHGEERELVYLFVHGLLHLLGYDHEEEGERALMRAKEEWAMAEVPLG